MKKTAILLFTLLFYLQGFTQHSGDSIVSIKDSVGSRIERDTANVIIHEPILPAYLTNGLKNQVYPYNKDRVKLVATANIAGYGISMVGLYSAWYKNYPQSSFHTLNDNREWLQVDKVGHVYSAYAWSYGSMETWRWTGIDRKKRIWLGGASGAVYQTVIEVLDGFSAQWGWSWGDFAGNIAGSGMLIAQELKWDEQRVKLKFSFHKKNYGAEDLNNAANSLYGKSITERFLKDYNAQTYWITANLKSFMPKSNIPAWLNMAVGYGAEGMFGAQRNVAFDNRGVLILNRMDIKRYRQLYLAPDVDLTKIKTGSKWLKVVLGMLNIFKFPTPSLEFSAHKFRWNWLHF